MPALHLPHKEVTRQWQVVSHQSLRSMIDFASPPLTVKLVGARAFCREHQNCKLCMSNKPPDAWYSNRGLGEGERFMADDPTVFRLQATTRC